MHRLDNNNILLEHYKRIYNAKPSPEIARTRSFNVKGRRPSSSGNIRPFTHHSTIFPQPGWKSLEMKHSLEDLSENRLSLQTNPTSFKSKFHSNSDLSNFQQHFVRSKPDFNIKPNRPVSAVVVSQFHPPFNSPQRVNIGLRHTRNERSPAQKGTEAKKYSSMQNLNGHLETNNGHEPQQFLSQHSLDQFGMRSATSLAERIDSFLQAVKFEELKISPSARQQYVTHLRPSVSSNLSFMPGNISSRKLSALSVSSFASKSKGSQQSKTQIRITRPAIRRSFTPKRPSTAPVVPKSNTVDPTRVTSKLANNRNYQAPRGKRQNPQKVLVESKNPTNLKAKPALGGEDYDDDFEPNEDEEEEEEDNSENVIMRQKQEWLYDQFQRVRARQRAALIIKRQENGVEKASSKDSAYGFSGGETSRLHTREPTPDNHNNVGNGFSKQLSRYQMKNRQQLLGKSNGTGYLQSRTTQPAPIAKPRQEAKRLRINTTYLKIVSEVTQEILKSSSFTENSIKRILDQHLSNSKEKHNLTKSEFENLFTTLKCELGLETSKTTPKGIQDLLMPDGQSKSNPILQNSSLKNDNFSAARLKKKVYNRGQSSSDSNQSNIILPSKQEVRKSDNTIKINVSQPTDDYEIMKMLREEMDLDDSMVEDILKASNSSQVLRRPASAQAQKSGLFKNLNISNLDVSFNASMKGSLNNSRRREELNQEKAKLIKSFALQGKECSLRTKYEDSAPNPKAKEVKVQETLKTEEKDVNDNTPRSSMLYQTDEESKEMSEAIANDPDSDNFDDESVEEEDHLKNV